ncbi:MAG: molecular chaperone TorD family protein [Eggerthellaceae bacterium]|nr:molecular chaperone TorD family protein [Eggerthellaceae bacterium]
MKLEQNPQQLAAVADFYLLLGLMLRLPQEDLVSRFSDAAFHEGLIEMIHESGFDKDRQKELRCSFDELKKLAEEGSLSVPDLRYAYTKAFTHPVKPSIFIYESQFLFWDENPEASYGEAPRTFISPAALDAERCYKKANLTQSADLNEPADHMSIELEFMSKLYDHKAKLVEQQDKDDENPAAEEVRAEIERTEALIQEYNYYHFSKWGIRFFEKCKTSNLHPYYQALGAIGSAFMQGMLSEK